MEKKQPHAFHKIALAALFTVGNSLIRYPWRQAEEELLFFFFVSVMSALIPAFLLYPLFRRLFRRDLSQKRWEKYLALVLSWGIGLYALLCALRSTADYVTFVTGLILPGANPYLLTILFLLCVIFLSGIPERGIDSFALLAFLATLAVSAGLFLTAIPIFRSADVTLQFPKEFSKIFDSVPVLLRESFLPLTVLSAYFALVIPKGGEKALVFGTLAGSGILLLSVLQALLTFGADLASGLTYPYSFSVRVLSVGQYFFRLEGFSYLFDYLSCLTRATVSLICFRKLFKLEKKKDG